jgi:hypothetical protein
MKVAAELNLPEGKVSIFRMNNKFILKIENQHLEQTYKISEMDHDLNCIEDVEKILDPVFLKCVMEHFQKMNMNLHETLNRNGF